MLHTGKQFRNSCRRSMSDVQASKESMTWQHTVWKTPFMNAVWRNSQNWPKSHVIRSTLTVQLMSPGTLIDFLTEKKSTRLSHVFRSSDTPHSRQNGQNRPESGCIRSKLKIQKSAKKPKIEPTQGAYAHFCGVASGTLQNGHEIRPKFAKNRWFKIIVSVHS